MKNKRIMLVPTLVLGTSLVVGGGTFALFASHATNSNNAFAAGTLQIALDKQDVGSTKASYFNVTNMAPGDNEIRPVTVSNTGSLQLAYTMSLSVDGFLGTHDSNHLTIAVYPTQADAEANTNQIDLTQQRTLDPQNSGGTTQETLFVKVSLPLAASNDYQGQSGTATITVNAVQTANNSVVHNLLSKSITNFDYSTTYGNQANQKSKPMASSDFSGSNAKSFTISDGVTTIPITLNWNIVPSGGFSIGQMIGSAVESEIQQYYFDHKIPQASWTLNAGSYSADNTFNIGSFQTGSSSTITLGGNDWSYFFQTQSFGGSNDDTSKNRSFTVSDGTHTATILLNSSYSDMDNLVNAINYQLQNAGVLATATKVDDSHFKLVTSASGVTLTTGGQNVSDFF